MLRLVVDESGVIWTDLLHKAGGRGFYLCMESKCLKSLNDKRLGVLKKNFAVVLPQAVSLLTRIEEALLMQIRQRLLQLKAEACMGRDAVMHQMWKRGHLLILLADDAGEALRRQVVDAVQKRQESGQCASICHTLPTEMMANIFERDTLSVIGLKVSKQTEKLKKHCVWYGCMKKNQELR